MKLETIYQDQLLPQIELILTTDNLEVLIDPVLLSNQTSEEEKKEDPKKKKQKKLDYMEDETVMDIDQGNITYYFVPTCCLFTSLSGTSIILFWVFLLSLNFSRC
jgi:hypothetical protein